MWLQISVVIVVLFFAITYCLIKFRVWQSFRTKTAGNVQLKDLALILLITIPYSFLSFYHLGSFKNQQMWYGNLPNKFIALKFAQPQQLGEVSFFACTVNGDFKIEGFTDNLRNTPIMLANQNDGKSKLNVICAWRVFQISSEAKFSQLKLTVISPQLNISKMLVRDHNQQIINQFQVSAGFVNKLDDISNLFVHAESEVKNYKKATLYLDAPYTAYSAMFFDDPSYAMMAYNYLEKIPYFNTAHPQLGILIISLGIILFGMNPFAWRFMSLASGVFLLPLIYLLAQKIFNNRRLSFFATLLMALDFMHFTISRLAVIEPFVTLFLLLGIYFFHNYLSFRFVNWRKAYRNLFYAGIYFGLAVATKWTAMFSLLFIFAYGIKVELFDVERYHHKLALFKLILLWLLIWLIIPFGIYLLSYIPFFIIAKPDNIWSLFGHLQYVMWHDHTVLMVQGKNPGARWWTWPLDLFPQSIYFWFNPTSLRSHSIVLMGNPIIYWVSILAIPSFAYYCFRAKYSKFLLVVICALWLPYIFIKRVELLYYFYAITPFVFIAISWWLSRLYSASSYGKKLVYGYFLLVGLAFIMFYPVISGIEINRTYVFYWLHWFKTWWF